MAVNNFLKGYPYLFVRESDQTKYFCTICTAFLEEGQLQSHLFDEHRAEGCGSGSFVRVCVEQTDKGQYTQKKYIFVCVICWGKFPSSTDMATHSETCKLSTSSEEISNRILHLTEISTTFSPVRSIEKEQTKVGSTPDITFIGNRTNTHSSPQNGGHVSVAVSPPMSSSSSPIVLEHPAGGNYQTTPITTSQSTPVKRGRKKQLHPQQVLPPYRVEERYRAGTEVSTSTAGATTASITTVNGGHLEPFLQQQFLQCSLCSEIMPSNNYAQHLKEYHKVAGSVEHILCPMCQKGVSRGDLPLHLTVAHLVIARPAVSSLVLWILSGNSNSEKPKDALKDPSKSLPVNGGSTSEESKPAMQTIPTLLPSFVNFPSMLQNVFPSLGGALPAVSNLFPMPTTTQPLQTVPATSAVTLSQPPIPSFLQALLNGDSVQAPQNPSTGLERKPLTTNQQVPSKSVVENVVSKLTRRHVGPNDKENFQCLVCSKWFAVPPVKHMRGHLISFKDENRQNVPLAGLGGSRHACLICLQICESMAAVEAHIANFHQPPPSAPQHKPNGSHVDDLPLGATYETSKQFSTSQDLQSSSACSNPSTEASLDPKGVELDNAGRVKSGKVRKQCELCGQWSNIKWFFKHMSENHQALFCRCCREYLPIHEQEEHRRWHAEPPYMGQKIRIENGNPVIIDRKERASLTPIGSLAPWGGSSGGMVVKAIDDGVIPSPRKRKNVGNVTPVGSGEGESPSKVAMTSLLRGPEGLQTGNKNDRDTLMPKETCPVCGILITYKNLARHIKLKHKIKYKFCHKCRKFVPNDTYEDHKLTCVQTESYSPARRSENDSVISDQYSEGHRELCDEELGHMQVQGGPECMDLSNTSPSGVGTPQSSISGGEMIDPSSGLNFDARKSDAFRANTSKTKLESLLGKEFKHPRRRCTICGYTVSYSNFKRHLRNAHPNEYSQCEKETSGDFGNALANFSHIVVDDDQNFSSGEVNTSSENNFVECRICGDHILQDFLIRHIIMNHPQIPTKKECAAVDEKEVIDVEDKVDEGNDEVEVEDSVPEVQDIDTNGGDTKSIKMRRCPICSVEMKSELVGKHCKLEHKTSLKNCHLCSEMVTKDSFVSHLRSSHGIERPNTRFGRDEVKNSLSQEGESEEESENQVGIDVDDDEGRLTIDIKLSTTDNESELTTDNITKD